MSGLRLLTTFFWAIFVMGTFRSASYGVPPELQKWLDTEQHWVQDLDQPVISLGTDNSFDSRSVLATSVSTANTRAPQFWYTGAQGEGKDQVFRLGLASTSDSVTCQKQGHNAVFQFPDGKTSILNISTLRNRDGWAWRYGRTGAILYFTATRFDQSPQQYAIREIHSPDGKSWSEPSPVVLQNACSPQVMRDGNDFRIEGFYVSYKSQTGCRLPDFGLRRIPQTELLCLKPEELGKPEFTIEGWLQEVEK